MIDSFVRSATITKIVDGDTLKVVIDLGWSMTKAEHIRLAGVDTPEIRGSRASTESLSGHYVTNRVRQLIADHGTDVVIRSREFTLGKYGRCIADVYFPGSGTSLSDYLIERRLGWPVDDGGSIIGERDLSRLTGIPEELR